MMEIKDTYNIEGGINLTGAILNALTGGAKIVLELGRSLGSAIRRAVGGTFCSI